MPTHKVSAAPYRLTVNGSELLDPSRQPIRLLGFNWQIGREQRGDGHLLRRVAQGSNMVRLVGILWGNTRRYRSAPGGTLQCDELQDDPELLWPQEQRGVDAIADCMTDTPPTYFNDDCFSELDSWVRDASEAGLWVILAVRGMYIAGQDYRSRPEENVFRNATLRAMMYAMWGHVAEHYASFDRIAAYEILSEPRDKEASAESVSAFYAGGCGAVQAADPRTPCLVGPAPYYKLYAFGDDLIIRGNRNVIYTFDYFNPDGYVFGTSSEVTSYGESYPCQSLYAGWAQVCSSWRLAPHEPLAFNRAWHEHNIETFIQPVQQKHRVPVLANQWLAVHGLTAAQGRYSYLSDVMGVLEERQLGWAWWTFIGGDPGGEWKHGSSEVVFRKADGSIMLDELVLDTMAPFLNRTRVVSVEPGGRRSPLS